MLKDHFLRKPGLSLKDIRGTYEGPEDMTNSYQAPQLIELGKAEVIILDQKQPGSLDTMMIPFAMDAVTIDDFDE